MFWNLLLIYTVGVVAFLVVMSRIDAIREKHRESVKELGLVGAAIIALVVACAWPLVVAVFVALWLFQEKPEETTPPSE